MDTEAIKENLYDTLIRDGRVVRCADGHLERTDDPRVWYRAFVLPGSDPRIGAIKEAGADYVTLQDAEKWYKGIIVAEMLRWDDTEPYAFVLMYAGVEV